MGLFKKKEGGKTGGETAPEVKPKLPEPDWREVEKGKNEALRKAVPQTFTLKMKETAGENLKIAEIQLSLKEATDDLGAKRLRYESADGSVKVVFRHFGYHRNDVSFEKFAGKELEFGFGYDVIGDPKDSFLTTNSFGVGKLRFTSHMANMMGASTVALVIPSEINDMRDTLKLASDKAEEIRRVHNEVGGAVYGAITPLASQIFVKLEQKP